MGKARQAITAMTLVVAAITTVAPSANAAVTPGQPTNLAAEATWKLVELSWDAPADNGLEITNYRIYREGTDGSSSVELADGQTTQHSDRAVENGVTYTYRVSAVNLVGEGAQSAPATATPGVASAPRDLTAATRGAANGTQVTLSWTAPTSDGGTPITSYRIYKNSPSNLVAEVDADTFSFTDRDAGAWQMYSVAAVGAGGEGAHAVITVDTNPCTQWC